MLQEYHVEQDGPDFYLREGSALVAVVTYAGAVVRDFDCEAAMKARDWFERQARIWGWAVHFSEPAL